MTAGNLRERLSSFVGRDAELEQLRETVRASRLVTLVGPGGVGKTRLAVEAAASCAKSTETAPGWSSWPASPNPKGWRRPWPARSGRRVRRSHAPFAGIDGWSSSCTTWPGGRWSSSSTTVST